MSSISSIGGGARPHHKPPSFEQIDNNSDGGISLDEFESAAPKGADSSKSEELFKKIDADGDGRISKAEAQANAPRLFAHFDQIDANGDGFITPEELQAAHHHGHRGPK